MGKFNLLNTQDITTKNTLLKLPNSWSSNIYRLIYRKQTRAIFGIMLSHLIEFLNYQYL